MLTSNISQQIFCDSGFSELGRSWGGPRVSKPAAPVSAQ